MKLKGIAAGMIAMLAAMTFGGCVSAEKYKEALAANNRAQSMLEDCRGDAQQARDAQKQLELDLATMKMAMRDRDRMIAELNAANADAMERFAELKRRYERDTAEIGPAPLGGAALPEPLDNQLQQWAEQYGDLVFYDRARGMVKFKTDLVFAQGSDDVSADASATLRKFAEIIQGAEGAEFNVYIAGHTDDIPIVQEATRRRHPTNWYLSVHRAVSVKDVLVDAGVSEARLGVMGFGQFHPIAPNAPGNKGNALNRRVEIWIVPPKQFLTTEAVEEPAET